MSDEPRGFQPIGTSQIEHDISVGRFAMGLSAAERKEQENGILPVRFQ